MGILGNKICKSCRKPKKSLNSDDICIECQEKIDRDTMLNCANKECNEKIGIEFKNALIKGTENNNDLSSETSSIKNNLSSKNKKYIENVSASTINAPNKTTIKYYKIILVAIIVGILTIVGLFLYNSSPSTSDEGSMAKTKQMPNASEIDKKNTKVISKSINNHDIEIKESKSDFIILKPVN